MALWGWIAIGLVVVMMLRLLGMSRRHIRPLRQRFGHEQERTVGAHDEGEAQEELLEHRERLSPLDIRPLPTTARLRYVDAWTGAQARFMGDPRRAVQEADRLATSVLRDRGYPIEDFDQWGSDVAAHHPRVAEQYRQARAIADHARRGDTSTEELRRGMLHYRALFEELLSPGIEEEPRSDLMRGPESLRL